MRFWANESVDYWATIGSSAAHGFPKRVDFKRIEAASSISDIGQCREPSEVLHGSRRFLSAFATIPAGCNRFMRTGSRQGFRAGEKACIEMLDAFRYPKTCSGSRQGFRNRWRAGSHRNA